MRRGICIVIAGPSGCGKTTIVEHLLTRNILGLRRSISATTRSPRPSEVDGRDYYFVSPQEFDFLASTGEMLEHAEVFGRRYGTPKAPVEECLAAGYGVVMVLDWQGHRSLLEKLPGDVIGIFLRPPSIRALKSRLRARGDTPEQIESRMAEASEQLSHADEFQFQVVNNSLPTAVYEVTGAIDSVLYARSKSAS